MQETLKTIRLLHHLIIVLSAAFLAFAMSPDEVPEIDAALAELSGLRDLDQNDFLAWMAAKTQTEMNSDRENFGYVQKLLPLALGVRTTGDFVFEPAFYAEWPEKDSSLGKWKSFFELGSLLEMYGPYIGYLREDGGIQSPPEIATLAERFQGSTYPLTRAVFHAPLEQRFPTNRHSGDYSFLERVFKERFDSSGTFELELHQSFQNAVGLVKVTVAAGTTISRRSTYGNQWLTAPRGFHLALIDPATGSFLSHAQRFWQNLEGQPVSVAIDTLTKKRALAPYTVTLWSVSVQQAVLCWLGPAVTLLFLTYLFVHIMHLRRLASKTAAPACDFPWVGLFKNWVSIGFLGATLFMLPLLANVAVMMRTFDGTHLVSYVGIVGTLLIVAVEIAMASTLVVVRKQLAKAAATAQRSHTDFTIER